MNLLKKCNDKILISILLIILSFFIFNCSVFASTFSDFNDSDLTYNFNVSFDDISIEQTFNDFKKTIYFNNDDYYYFVGWNFWKGDKFAYVIKKDNIKFDSLFFFNNDFDSDRYSFAIDFGEGDFSDCFSDVLGYNSAVNYNYDIDNHTSLKFSGIKVGNTFNIPFITNFPVLHHTLSNGNVIDFFLDTPQDKMVLPVEAIQGIPQMILKNLLKILPIGLILLSLFLLISVIKSVIFRSL